jgi:1-aminocyclopropane-1-carboxylate deaminase
MTLDLTSTPIISKISYHGIEIGILRLDLIHPEISGNKWFKLKYNLKEAIFQKKENIITFGGAYSNHIAATAKACNLTKIRSVGYIRGEDLSSTNPTLSYAKQLGMELIFLTREDYRKKNEPEFLSSISMKHPNSYIVPEGGNNELGEKGCEEILDQNTNQYSHIFCAYGTGCTFHGLAKSLKPNQFLTGINVLNNQAETYAKNAIINNDFHFGGYAKYHTELIDFKTKFEKEYNIALDYVYTSKLFYAVFDAIKKNKFSSENKLLIIHSGGLQGNKGFEERYNLKANR